MRLRLKTAYFGKRAAIALAAVLLLASFAPSAWTQAGAIKIVVPYTPGSGPDILARLMAEQIGRTQGATVVVENRPGAGTVIGTESVERAAPDGHTVLLVANSFVVNPPLKRASYDPTTSFEPVCYLAATPMVLVVLGSSPYRTLGDLITAARARPGELAFASGGPGSSLHVAIEVLKRGEHQCDVRALWRHCACDQRADGQPCGGGVGRLSHGGVAAQLRRAARACHHL